VTLIFEKKSKYFSPKIGKIAENCVHNIDPRKRLQQKIDYWKSTWVNVKILKIFSSQQLAKNWKWRRSKKQAISIQITSYLHIWAEKEWLQHCFFQKNRQFSSQKIHRDSNVDKCDIFLLCFSQRSTPAPNRKVCLHYIKQWFSCRFVSRDVAQETRSNLCVACRFVLCDVARHEKSLFMSTDLGSMLWSLISAIFANFLRKNWRFS
jgi:hypothetical protein